MVVLGPSLPVCHVSACTNGKDRGRITSPAIPPQVHGACTTFCATKPIRTPVDATWRSSVPKDGSSACLPMASTGRCPIRSSRAPIEIAVSRDLLHWERVAEREVFIGVEPWTGDNYGTSQLLPSGAPVVRDDGEIWCYYNALRLPGSRKQYEQRSTPWAKRRRNP